MTWLNIGSGTWRAPEPWVNVDVVDNDEVHPDVLADPDGPLPFDDGTAQRIFCGHVLEHVPWVEVPAFLADVHRVLAPGGELLAVGPDVYRALERWKDGTEPWEIVQACLEHTHNYGFVTDEQWPNARHWWNCTEERAAGAVIAAGFVDVVCLPQPDRIYGNADIPGYEGWPSVGWSPWQFGVHARRPCTGTKNSPGYACSIRV